MEHQHPHHAHLSAAERLYNQAMDSKARVREAAQRSIQVGGFFFGFLVVMCGEKIGGFRGLVARAGMV